jgi:hypothetical protein
MVVLLLQNWGMITFRDAILLHHPNRSSTRNKELSALVICHELAHQVQKSSAKLSCLVVVWQLLHDAMVERFVVERGLLEFDGVLVRRQSISHLESRTCFR